MHRGLGPELLEKIYEACFCHELGKRNINFRKLVALPIYYDGIKFDDGLRMDVRIEEIIIPEIKAIETVNPLWQAQIMSHLKLAANNIGFLINFNVTLIKKGIRRYCLE